MLFLLHLLLLLHGAFGLLLTKLKTVEVLGISPYDAIPAKVVELLRRIYPPQLYQVRGVSTGENGEMEYDSQKAYLASAGTMAYAAWWLHSKHTTR